MTGPTERRQFSASRPLALGLGGVVVLLGGLVGWGVLASISGAVIATGHVAVESRNHVIERIDGGTVSEVRVRDGDLVARDDILLRLADTEMRADAVILEAQYAELAALRNRLEAEFRGADAIVWDETLLSLARTDATIREVLEGQERLFRARRAARSGEVALLRERIGQAHEEIRGLEAQAESLEHQNRLIARELDVNRDMFEKGLTRLNQLLALERATKNLEGLKGTNAATIARTRGRIAEMEIQILQIDARRVEEAEEKARAAKAEENRVREQLALVRERLEKTEVRAPATGIVFGTTIFAPGAVVRPGEPILYIVPEGSDLVVMARVEPIHVDQIYAGQSAVLRFTAFPQQATPEAEGHVVRVSADAVQDAESGLSWYEVELAIGGPVDADTMSAPDAGRAGVGDGSDRPAAGISAGAGMLAGGLALTPGMPVEVHIRTGERSAISYLAKPLADFFQRAMREE